MKTKQSIIVNNQITGDHKIMEQNNINVVNVNALATSNETQVSNVEVLNYIAVETVYEYIGHGKPLNEDAIIDASEDIRRFLNEALKCKRLVHARQRTKAEHVFGELCHDWRNKHTADVENMCSEIVGSLDAGLNHGPDKDDDYDAALSVREYIQSGAKPNRNAIANASTELGRFLAKACQCQRLLHARKWVEADTVLGTMTPPHGYYNDIPHLCTEIYESLWAGVEHGPDAYID